MCLHANSPTRHSQRVAGSCDMHLLRNVLSLRRPCTALHAALYRQRPHLSQVQCNATSFSMHPSLHGAACSPREEAFTVSRGGLHCFKRRPSLSCLWCSRPSQLTGHTPISMAGGPLAASCLSCLEFEHFPHALPAAHTHNGPSILRASRSTHITCDAHSTSPTSSPPAVHSALEWPQP